MTKTTNKIEKQITRKNKRFEEATPAQRRVMIAQDILNQIKLRKYKPVIGIFVGSTQIKQKHIDIELQDLLLLEKPPVCDVCAVGAIMLSYIRFRNNFKISEYNFNCERFGMEMDDIKTNFSEGQIILIEKAYEKGAGAFNEIVTDQDEKAVSFGYEVSNDKKRLIAIMENIIANRGTFVP